MKLDKWRMIKRAAQFARRLPGRRDVILWSGAGWYAPQPATLVAVRRSRGGIRYNRTRRVSYWRRLAGAHRPLARMRFFSDAFLELGLLSPWSEDSFVIDFDDAWLIAQRRPNDDDVAALLGVGWRRAHLPPRELPQESPFLEETGENVGAALLAREIAWPA